MPSTIRQVARALLGHATELRDLRARLLRAHAEVDRWKQRFEQRSADIGRQKTELGEMKQRLELVERRLQERRRTGLSAAVLAQLLPARAVERPLLASEVAAAVERAQKLLAASTEYGSVLRDADARLARLDRAELEGVAWWLPKDEATAGRSRRLQAQGFPVRAILQTREVALGGLMLDIGANIGRTSIPRVLLGDVRAVYAAEPDPANYACLVQNVIEHGLEGFVLPDRVAVGAVRGEARLRRSPYIGGHRVLKGTPAGRAKPGTVAVDLWPLDEWMARVGADPRSVSFVKVDTQGFEADVLLGARDLLARRHVAWQMEVDPMLLKRAGTALETLLSLFQAHFTHFIDIGTRLPGARSRPVADLAEALDYLGRVQKKTDVVLYSGAG